MQMTLNKALFIPCITFTFIATDPYRWITHSHNLSVNTKVFAVNGATLNK